MTDKLITAFVRALVSLVAGVSVDTLPLVEVDSSNSVVVSKAVVLIVTSSVIVVVELEDGRLVWLVVWLVETIDSGVVVLTAIVVSWPTVDIEGVEEVNESAEVVVNSTVGVVIVSNLHGSESKVIYKVILVGNKILTVSNKDGSIKGS